jgi:urease accessory protein
MTKLVSALALVLVLVLTDAALAHAPLMGIGGVPGGVLHAVLIPEHGMSLVALGLVMGRQERSARRSGEFLFLAALVLGLIAVALNVEQTAATDVLIAAIGILGLLIAAAWSPPFLGWPLAGIAGVAFALDSAPEVTSQGEAIRMLVGSGVGAALALAVVAEGSVRLDGNIARIAMRVLGSWMAAIAMLVVSLRIVTRIAIG